MPLHIFWFLLMVCLLLALARLGCLGWLRLQPSHSRGVTIHSRVHRRLLPRTPLDCPACRLASTASSGGEPTPEPVRPWREVKSRRGAPKRVNTDGFACPNQQCPYYGITDAQIHALVGDGKHGQAEHIQTFRGPACRSTFTSRRHTPLYRLKNSRSADRHSAVRAGRRAGPIRRRTGRRAIVRPPSPRGSLAQEATLRSSMSAASAISRSPTSNWTTATHEAAQRQTDPLAVAGHRSLHEDSACA